jgi:hypothetical protein
MKSPFPGMDPYIEERGLFEDFHNKLISEIERTLSAAVPERYVVRLPERSYVVLEEAEGNKEHVFLPDVSVLAPQQPPETVGIAVAEPAVDDEGISMRAFVADEFRETFVEVYVTDPEETLVTCIEALSPSNKRAGSEGWNVYLRKRQGILMGTANFVEIDLVRGGDKMPMMDSWPSSPYYLLVARKLFAPACRVWPAYLQRLVPKLRIPLLHPDPDVVLDLQAMIDAIFLRSRYGRSIDYTRPLKPPLSADESAWLAQRLHERSA